MTWTVGRKTDDTERGEKGTEDAKTYKQDQDALKEMKKRRFEDIKQKKRQIWQAGPKKMKKGRPENRKTWRLEHWKTCTHDGPLNAGKANEKEDLKTRNLEDSRKAPYHMIWTRTRAGAWMHGAGQKATEESKTEDAKTSRLED